MDANIGLNTRKEKILPKLQEFLIINKREDYQEMNLRKNLFVSRRILKSMD